MQRIKLFCFPYAGGSSIIFHKWKAYLDTHVELIPVELAGRGRRLSEPLYNDVSEAVDDVLKLIKDKIDDAPYFLFGHSLGARISYEVAQRISVSNLSPPKHIFFSGRGAPHVKREDDKQYHLMDAAEFKKEVLELGGTPPEFFEHPELMELFLPMLKNDFKMAETGIVHEVIRPLQNDITVFLGKDDDLTAAQCDGWKNHTSGVCNIHHFEGGHFFLHQETSALVNIINSVSRTIRSDKSISAF